MKKSQKEAFVPFMSKPKFKARIEPFVLVSSIQHASSFRFLALLLEQSRMTTRKAKLKEKKKVQIRLLLLASQVVYDWPCNLIAEERRTLWTWEKKPPSKE